MRRAPANGGRPPTIGEAISELKRERTMRAQVYPRILASAPSKAAQLAVQMARLEKAIAVLEALDSGPRLPGIR